MNLEQLQIKLALGSDLKLKKLIQAKIGGERLKANPPKQAKTEV